MTVLGGGAVAYERGTPVGVALAVQGYPAHKKLPAPYSHHMALCRVLLLGPCGVLFRMSEVTLYGVKFDPIKVLGRSQDPTG